MYKSGFDRIYYDINIPYNPNNDGFSAAIFQQQLNQPLILNPQDYSIAVTRFTIPTANIPIFIAEIENFGVDPLETIYSVTVGYNGAFSPQTFVQYVSSQPNAPQMEKGLYYYVYSYQWFLDMVNTAIAAAHAATPAIPMGSLPPYFQYDPVNEKISLVAQEQYYSSNTGTPPIITLYCNYVLFRFLDGFILQDNGLNATNGSNIQFIIENLGYNNYQPTNVAPYYTTTGTQADYLIMTQEYQTLANWNSFQSLQLISNLLPIIQEVVPSTQNNTTVGANQGVFNSQGVLQSFEPLIEFGPEARTIVQYQNPAQYHLIDLIGTTPITRVDISIYWTDIDGNQYLLDTPIRSKSSIQLMFIRKGSYYLR